MVRRDQWRRCAAAILALGCSWSAWAATKDVKTVVATVGALWSEEAHLAKFHEELKQKFKDAPSYEDLRDKERWVATVDVAEAKHARSVAARTTEVPGVAKGDIVEIAYAEPRKAAAYADLPRVVRVICRRSAADFEACKASTKMGAFKADGQQTSWGD